MNRHLTFSILLAALFLSPLSVETSQAAVGDYPGVYFGVYEYPGLSTWKYAMILRADGTGMWMGYDWRNRNDMSAGYDTNLLVRSDGLVVTNPELPSEDIYLGLNPESERFSIDQATGSVRWDREINNSYPHQGGRISSGAFESYAGLYEGTYDSTIFGVFQPYRGWARAILAPDGSLFIVLQETNNIYGNYIWAGSFVINGQNKFNSLYSSLGYGVGEVRPDGWNISGSLGTNGTPTIQAGFDASFDGTGSLILTRALGVDQPQAPPTITSQPAGLTVLVGDPVTFTVVAAGYNPTYQWRKDGVNIANATNATLTLSNVQTNQVGSYSVVVSNPAGSVTSSNALLTVNRLAQTITFAALPTKLITDAPFTLSGTASSGLAVSYTSSNPGVASVSGNVVTIVGAGTTTITASQAGNTTYLAAPGVTQNLTVDPFPQYVTFERLHRIETDDGPIQLTATASSGLPVYFVSLDPSVATVSGDTLTPLTAGTVSILARQPGDAQYQSAEASQSLTILDPVIPPVIVTQPVGGAPPAGGSYTFNVTAERGSVYQWYKDGQPIAGATADSLTLNNLALADNGNYHVEVKGAPMTRVSIVDAPLGSAQWVEVAGNHAYVACGAGGLAIYSLANPGRPMLVSTLTNVPAAKLAVSGTDVFLDWQTEPNFPYAHTVYRVDASDPLNPALTGSAEIAGESVFFGNLIAAGNYLLACGYYVTIFDISTPGDPVQIAKHGRTAPYSSGIFSDSFFARGAVFNGRFFFGAASNDQTLKIADFANLLSPQEVYSASGYWQADVSGNLLLTHKDSGIIGIGNLTIFDITNPAQPVKLSETLFPTKEGSHLEGFYAHGNRLLAGTFLIDISNPQQPKKVGDQLVSGSYIAQTDDYIYVADGTGLQVFDARSPVDGVSSDVASLAADFTPLIDSPHLDRPVLGRPFTYAITAINTPDTFGATGLPPGLSVDQNTGVISGTPTAAGDYLVTLSAGNSSGTGQRALRLTVLATGYVAAWGLNNEGQTDVPADPGEVVDVSAYSHSLVLKADGTVVAWGPNFYGQTNVPAGLTNVIMVQAGHHHHSLALRKDGSLVVWGAPSSVPAGLSNVVSMDAGYQFSLALKADGSVVAWGDNQYGQVDGAANFAGILGIEAGNAHAVAIQSDGSVIAWGNNELGQTNVPAGLSGVTAVAAGRAHSLALKSDGTVAAWGDNNAGQTDVPAGLSGVVEVTAGHNHSAARKNDGSIVLWGSIAGAPAGLPSTLAIASGESHMVALVDAIPVQFVSQPASQTVNATSDAAFSVTATGTAPLSYQWFRNGTPVPDANGSTLALNGVTTDDAGTYHVEVRNWTGVFASSNATLTVDRLAQSITFTLPDTKLTTDAPFTLTATASSGLPVSHASSNPAVASISGNTLTLTGAGTTIISATQAGNNVWAPAPMEERTLTVHAPLTITGQPFDLATRVDSNVVFSVTVTGSDPIGYVWRHNGAIIPDATTGTLALNGVTTNTAGIYTVGITNLAGGLLSRDAVLTVDRHSQTISFPDIPVQLTTNAPFTLGATTDSGLPLAYESVDPELATVLDGTVTIHSAGSTTITIRQAGDERFLPASPVSKTLVVHAPLVISQQPAGVTTHVSSNATLSVAVTGSAPIRFQWRRNGISLPQQTNATLQLPDVQTNQAGLYSVAITNPAGGLISSDAPLVVRRLVQSVDFAPLPGKLTTDQPFVLTATADSGLPVTFRSDNPAVATIDENVLTIVGEGTASITAEQEGDAKWLNAVRTRQLTVYAPVVITTQPMNAVVNVSSNALFAVVATGTEPLLYQWRQDGVVLPGETNATLALTNVGTNQAGAYSVLVSNPAGVAGSSNATLIVNRLQQTIAFPSPGGRLVSDAPFALAASASSELPVSYASSNPSVASIDGNTVTIHAVGSTVITASQAGDAIWRPAQDVAHTFGVFAQLAIAEHPQDQLVGVGSNAVFRVTVAGGPVDFQWYQQGTAMPGETNDVLVIAHATKSLSGSYHVEASNPAATLVSSNAVLQVLDPVAISRQPTNITADAGIILSFSAEVSGDGPIRYQWLREGVELPGQTNATLHLVNVTTNHAGNYQLRASNPVLSATSSSAVLTVNRLSQAIDFAALPPRLLGDAPFPLTATSGSGLLVNFSSHNPGVATINGDTVTVVAPGTTVITASQAGDAIWRPAAAVARALNVYPPVQITQQPTSTTVLEETDATFTVSATGGPLSYQWFHGTNRLTNATAATLQLPNVATNQAGSYRVEISNPVHGVTSVDAILTVTPRTAPEFIVPPHGVVAVQGGSAQFTAQATGTAPLHYQWRFEGNPIPGANAPILTLDSISPAHGGLYDLVVSNDLGIITSPAVNLVVVLDPNFPSLLNTPATIITNVGAFFTLTAEPAGQPPFTYQWQKNGFAIPGQTGRSLTLFGLQVTDSGTYSVVLANALNSVTGLVAQVDVRAVQSPAILRQPLSTNITAGETLTLSVAASGFPAPSYQWIRNLVALPNANSSNLVVTNIGTADAGAYIVQVFNEGGVAQSQPAEVTVVQAPVVTRQPESVSVPWGQPASFTATVEAFPSAHLTWFRNGLSVANDGNYSGANSPGLSLLSAQAHHAGTYQLVAFNSAGNTTSAPVTLTVTLPGFATRAVPRYYFPDRPLTVLLSVNPPPNVSTHTVEDTPPAGWTASAISHGGHFDAVSGSVRFGPFADGAPRNLSYQLTPATGAAGPRSFSGTAAGNSIATPVSGDQWTRHGIAFRADAASMRFDSQDFRLNLDAEAGSRVVLEYSTNAIDSPWIPLQTNTAGFNGVFFIDFGARQRAYRFYRARVR